MAKMGSITDTSAMVKLKKGAIAYAREISDLISSGSTTEATYYPAVRSLHRSTFNDIVKLGNQVVSLLDPGIDPYGAIKAALGKDAKTLAVAKRTDNGTISEADLTVEYSYYGAATGRWNERQPQDSEAQYATWGKVTRDLYLNDSVFLSHVPEAIWHYELGGYPVLKKWLGYRQANRRGNASMSLRELDEFRGIIQRIAVLLTLRPRLDAAYEKATERAWLIDEL